MNLTDSGLETDTMSEIFEDLLTTIAASLELTDETRQYISTDPRNLLGLLLRIVAENEASYQETLVEVYEANSLNAEGTNLDRVLRTVGVERDPAQYSRAAGLAGGIAGTIIPDGARVQHDIDGTIWRVADGPHTLPATVDVVADSALALDPGADDEWTILDVVSGWQTYESTATEVVGAPQESDASLRAKHAVEVYIRGSGPLDAIESVVSKVDGVTYVRAWDNTSLATDANGLPPKSINVVVEGGDDTEIAEAILSKRPGGIELYGTSYSELHEVRPGQNVTVGFDRVQNLNRWMRITVTNTGAEEAPSPTQEQAIRNGLADYGLEIGEDAVAYKVVQAVADLDLPGIDAITVEFSANGSSWSTAKIVASIRQRIVFDSTDRLVFVAV
jgi:uncharacterized phage protein gp47/JayE